MSVADIVKKYCVCADDYTKRGRVDPECRCDVLEEAINEAVEASARACDKLNDKYRELWRSGKGPQKVFMHKMNTCFEAAETIRAWGKK